MPWMGDEVDLSVGVEIIKPLTPSELRYRELTTTDHHGHDKDCLDPNQVEFRDQIGGAFASPKKVKWCKSCQREVIR